MEERLAFGKMNFSAKIKRSSNAEEVSRENGLRVVGNIVASIRNVNQPKSNGCTGL